MISLTCTSCQKVLEIDDAFAGGVCRCQHCGTIQTVPASLKKRSRPGAPAPPAGAAGAKTLYEKKARAGAATGELPTEQPKPASRAAGSGDGASAGDDGSSARPASRRAAAPPVAAPPVAAPPAAPPRDPRRLWPILLIAGLILLLIVGMVLWMVDMRRRSRAPAARANPAAAPIVVLLSRPAAARADW